MPIAIHSPANAAPLGSAIPVLIPHAISVSLPTWKDTVGYEEGEARVVDKMQTGYPRFFIHRSIQKLQDICLAKFGLAGEKCILLPSPKIAQAGRAFLLSRPSPISSRIVEFVICPSSSSLKANASGNGNSGIDSEEVVLGGVDCIELQILLFASEEFPIAKQFWQHTGDGVSSRYAERALAFLGEGPAGPLEEVTSTAIAAGSTNHIGEGSVNGGAMLKKPYSRNRHYGRTPTRQPSINGKMSIANTPLAALSSTTPSPVNPQEPTFAAEDALSPEHSTYLEERYGRNLPLASSSMAKQALRRRIAGVLLPHEEGASSGAGAEELLKRGLGGSGGGRTEMEKVVTEEEVYLFPTGMSAIWHAHDLATALRRKRGEKNGKSICFGFPYTDTLKILQKWGPGCHFFGHGTTSDLDSLTALLHSIRSDPSSEPPLQSLFCEFPSNPLLRSPDLVRLRALADEFGFLIVVDETVGNFVNIEVASWADVVVSSLTKVFSGDTNVMGGSMVLNPNGRHFNELKQVLTEIYEDTYFPEDSIYMERNSRDFRTRIATINDNGFALTDYLRSKSLANPDAPRNSVIKEVYYPRFITSENYAAAQRLPTTGNGGFGGLFSLTFTESKFAEAFFDNLDCFKGPSLGTNFTLSCLYTILAHYMELDWAKEYGVEEGLVRISVGLEDIGYLKEVFDHALRAAEAVRG